MLCSNTAAHINTVRRASPQTIATVRETTGIPPWEHGTKHLGAKQNAHTGRASEDKRWGPSSDQASAVLLAEGKESEIPQVRIFDPRPTGPDNDFVQRNPQSATAWTALAWLHDALLEREHPGVWAKMHATWGDLEAEGPLLDKHGRGYRLFEGTCFGGMALNRDIGTRWHVDDGDISFGKTMVTIMAWGAFSNGAFNMLANGTMTTVEVARDV